MKFCLLNMKKLDEKFHDEFFITMLLQGALMKTLDCRGLPCPQPVIRCRELLEKEQPAHCVVLVDNEAAEENVRRFWEQRGFTVHSGHPEANMWRLEALRDASKAVTADAPSACPAASSEGGKTLVFITTPTLGRGDDGLGQRLMETFLTTLPELGESLWRIVLLNGGVKLAATPGPALEALQSMERQGARVLVCGTCLAHYQLAEAKAVGETSNMMDIVTSLALADKVIRP